jgi:hypothetical protein
MRKKQDLLERSRRNTQVTLGLSRIKNIESVANTIKDSWQTQ